MTHSGNLNALERPWPTKLDLRRAALGPRNFPPHCQPNRSSLSGGCSGSVWKLWGRELVGWRSPDIHCGQVRPGLGPGHEHHAMLIGQQVQFVPFFAKNCIAFFGVVTCDQNFFRILLLICMQSKMKTFPQWPRGMSSRRTTLFSLT